MTSSMLLENATDSADLDLDVQISDDQIDADGLGFAARTTTSPSTYGIMSRCPSCC
ncbi:SCO0268 family class II lanthipeptide [Streptomyces sp. NPDC050617]|uniref:SCO0268 family class II lanthipeptide n=1 Tax=Streptomyces sp. NPDC050617 TaxID=3154628 RepID=UPI00344A78F2